ncbi:dephospho-CoA kinase [Gulosibacter molinativorax]|uniref:Dephospho-CoA kinase n=1 Tax=Gulosibacter molinativorax TaxID=256821 RepID=A0ABT7C8K9_9MICO|nr:dephospho-CoA kinase [Gulosibacter molinativorax]MDJ1371099.1 dephospho-CoA kinase [Gulosibacter molinativorax]QUY61459.1 Dephospho-CoA kinase [Gulosibacter molinativorax]
MITIALTGGIASGKTTISTRLRELGAVIIDADEIARKVVEPGEPALGKIAKRFGESVINADGTLDRKALADIVFNDEEALKSLNEITHPEIGRYTQRMIAEVSAEDPNTIIVHDIPLLAENRTNYDYDFIWVADSPADVRRERLMEDRGMSAEEAQARIDAQVSDEERRMIADVVIDTTRAIPETLDQVDELFARLDLRHSSNEDEVHYDTAPITVPVEERSMDN